MGETNDRIRSLDGLRGVAAVVVLVHHSLVSIAPLGAVYFGGSAPRGFEWLVHSPLHLVWAGPEAVYVFFVLSGLVLTLPALRRRYDWRSYYPSRLIRLYLPVIGAVLFAVAWALIVPRSATIGHGTWMERQDQAVSVFSVIRNMTLLSPDWLNPPLWSLRWEVAFSVLLPLYVLVVTRVPRWWPFLVVGAMTVSTVGVVIHDKGILVYLPMFMLGCALAVPLRDGSASRSHVWPWLMGCGLLGITCSWWLGGLHLNEDALSNPVILLSAVLIVVAAVRWSGARRMLETRPIRWLGRISFSLYLTHNAIVVAVNSLLPADQTWWTPVLAIPLSLGVSVVFFRLVEAPAHVLAKRVARALERRPDRTEAGSTPA